ncbi:imidazoleglycerol-phosphate dehydratase HisB [Oceanobacillus sp. FSL W8-0428]|uniref:imidazoleglycerol-phosphate dehydratase HisB n=1 Tax=Oceanobacillus sp. FSL W8-0428 TaxID=2921715 RepID=UPI0030FACBD6
MRQAEKKRQTKETGISLALNLDGEGKSELKTGVGFLDHMLTLFSKHGGLDLQVECDGDLEVDQHHTVEDIGIVLGQAFNEALGTKESIKRYATATTPMDESLSSVSIDISGRSFLVYRVDGLKDKVGSFDTELVEEFLIGFSSHAKVTLHVEVLYGSNTHHMIESMFKGLGRAIREAVSIDPTMKGVPSTKGSL